MWGPLRAVNLYSLPAARDVSSTARLIRVPAGMEVELLRIGVESFMKNPSIAILASSIFLFGAGCASNRGQASRTIPPAGPVYAAPSPPGVIPAGTQLALRTDERIDTNRAVPGKTYSATIDRPVITVRGNEIVPAGSPAQLVVVSSTGGGTFGTAQLDLAVRSLTVNGRTYNVSSEVNEEQARQQGLGANRRTAETVGGGALLGTLIGAIAGGGTGAAIGAAAGAAGGAAVNVLTKGDRVRVPPETLLTFRLDRPIRLEGFRR